ncbi:hypothetical protein PTSG_03885 [Salpingoeca rosetta]|uniref:Uncharacterized protein n=1 Tax=Salpingoeca rosetta (strain ATCC 50818 / BSB-021) TaxID=946362 RepID=F2U5N9_SALR5|nr:uncharacterized protein PTSG_03885 [Salpingoeca rosetta]EGD83255.1 hypothetical protein PTSG_03885 [Salpingoeca rosetta]|eukprot:XP_004995619.1 hypothetical protein PTSG_03885 [Salpingoeca rosetta]
MEPVENESLWDSTVASLTPVSNATVTTPADHDTYKPGQYLDLHLSGSSTPAVDPAYSKMEYDLVLSSSANGKTVATSPDKKTTAVMMDLQYGCEMAATTGTSNLKNDTAFVNANQAGLNFCSSLRLPNPAGAVTLFDEIVTRTDTGQVIEETQRLDLINTMKHLYCKDPIAKQNDSLFTSATVDVNEFGLVKPAHRELYQPSRSNIEDAAIMKGLLNPASPITALTIDRDPLEDSWCNYKNFLKFVEDGSSPKNGFFQFVHSSVNSGSAYANLPSNIKPYLYAVGNVFEVWSVQPQGTDDPSSASGTKPAKSSDRKLVGYCGLATDVRAGDSPASGTNKIFGLILKDGTKTVYGPYADGLDKAFTTASSSELDKSAGTYYVIRPITNISYSCTVPVMHEIPSAMFMHPQGNTIYVNHLGGLRMRWHLANADNWFRRHEQAGWDTKTDSFSYEIQRINFRFRTVTPSLDMEAAMQEAMQSADGTFFDIMTYTHVAQPIPAGVNDYTINLPSFTQRRAFSLFAIPEYNQSLWLNSVKFADILKTPIDTADPKDLSYRVTSKGGGSEHGFKEWQWQINQRQQPSHPVSVESLSKCPQGLLATAGVNAQEQAKALANIGLPVKDLRNQSSMLVIPRRLSAHGGFADLLTANPNLRVRFTKVTPESFIMHCFCAHQRRVTVSNAAGVVVSE